MLRVAAFEVGNPVAVRILVKGDNLPWRRNGHKGIFYQFEARASREVRYIEEFAVALWVCR